ncbi:MAG: peptidylprolyl isomerase [Polyangiales bacterium]
MTRRSLPRTAHLLVACGLLAACRAAAPPQGPPDGPAKGAPEGSATPTPEPTAAPAAIKPGEALEGSTASKPAAEAETSAGLVERTFTDTKAPERFTARLETTKGALTIDVRRSWAPRGADRFYSLARLGYFDGNAFFRVIGGFIAQVGLHGDPAVNEVWRSRRIADDPPTQSNIAGMVSFAAAGKGTRTTQIFIDLDDNAALDKLGFAPFGRVREIDTARKLHAGYGESAPAGHGPSQARIQREGSRYLAAEFPQLDSIISAKIIDEKPLR